MKPFLLMLSFAAVLCSCVSLRSGAPIWSEESAKIVLTRKATGFMRSADKQKTDSSLTILRKDIPEEGLRLLERIRTVDLSGEPCRGDALWTRTITVEDQRGAAKTYYTEEYACPKELKREIVSAKDFEEIAAALSLPTRS